MIDQVGKNVIIRKGLDIRLKGMAEKATSALPLPETFALQPPEFTSIVPKLLVQEGDEVKAGTPLFFDKDNEAVKFCSPVSGEVIDIRRGDKRKILEIRLLADKETEYLSFEKMNPINAGRETIIENLLKSGAWPLIRQRPFGIIANPLEKPKSIFISTFDTHPLAPDYNYIMKGNEEAFQSGLEVLKQLTDGKLHLNLKTTEGQEAAVFSNAKGVEINRFSGPHPSGNVGVQIHHIDPVNKGEVVWCVNPQDVVIIGKVFNQGIFDATKTIALTGSQVLNPHYYKTVVGAWVKYILEDAGLKNGENRIINGNVLTGTRINSDGYLGFYESQITVIPEGNEPEFMGWIKPGFDKFSKSRAYFSWLTPQKNHNLNTNMHGEERPFVISGQYESVFPMDIYPVHLIKSILVEDLELMENLGIYEVVEEDFALCEFVCTSKIESQQIIRQGLDIVRKEMA